MGYRPWGRKESDTTERLHSLTHSWILTVFLEKTEANPWKLTEFCMFLMDYVMASLEENKEGQVEQVSSHFLKVGI